LSAAEAEELCEMRIALESCAIRAVIKHASSDDLNEAERILDQIDREPQRWAELNTAFHVALYKASRRPRLLATIVPIIQSCERYLHHEVEVLDNFDVSQREHRELLDAIKSRNAKCACAILARHIEQPGAENIRTLRSKGLE
jgi:DNA-binding GntR family transcriptional regulator